MACTHENQQLVEDMPIADPDTLEFKGRFNVQVCLDCGEHLSETQVTESPLAEMFPSNTAFLTPEEPTQEPLPGV